MTALLPQRLTGDLAADVERLCRDWGLGPGRCVCPAGVVSVECTVPAHRTTAERAELMAEGLL